MKSAVLGPLTIGGLNCDGAVDFGDVNPLALVLADPDGYRETDPDCHPEAADANRDGQIDYDDLNPFVELPGR